MDAKNKKLLMIVGGIAVVSVFGFIVYKNMKPTTTASMPGPVIPLLPQKDLSAEMMASAQPRGKLPWATGDVSLWDDE